MRDRVNSWQSRHCGRRLVHTDISDTLPRSTGVAVAERVFPVLYKAWYQNAGTALLWPVGAGNQVLPWSAGCCLTSRTGRQRPRASWHWSQRVRKFGGYAANARGTNQACRSGLRVASSKGTSPPLFQGEVRSTRTTPPLSRFRCERPGASCSFAPRLSSCWRQSSASSRRHRA